MKTTLFVTSQSLHTYTRCVHVGAVAALLTACGGGGAELVENPASALSDSSTLAKTTTGYKPIPITPSVLTPLAPSTPSTQAPIVLGARITDIRLQNTGLPQSDVPFTFGQVVAPGAMQPGEGLAAKLADGTVLRLQTDVKATHADGSVRHVVISGILPALAANQTQTLELFTANAPANTVSATAQALLSAGLTGKVSISADNVAYNASLADALADPAAITWLAGGVVNEWIGNAPLKDASGATHPNLTVRFAVRWYPGLDKQARVDVVVENTKTFVAGRTLTYDVNVEVGGRQVYAKAGLTHYHHARWHQTAWWNAAGEPMLNLQHNTAYLIATKAVPNYDQSLVIPESTLAGFASQLNGKTGPMTIGPANAYMGTTGGRGDIGPLPNWTVSHLLSMDKRAWDLTRAGADGSGSWSIHYRDETTGYPVRTDNEKNRSMSLHNNMKNSGPLPVPRCAAGASCGTPFSSDTSHQPSLVYVPYLLTGDYYYLEELQFWAAHNPLATAPGSSGYGQGLVRWQQVRGQAWSLRTLGHVSYITPDNHPLKGYFTKQLDYNLDFYHQTYVVGKPNKLGVYDGSGTNAFKVDGSAPWQDDFLTWSFGYLSELGFAKATPILQWKAQYSVGRMTAPGFCWISGADYYLIFRDSNASPIYSTFAELYNANYGGTSIKNDDRKVIQHPQGLRYIDQQCASQAQADWMTAADKKKWVQGQMMGYAGSGLGYPSNMQPALAVAATSGIPDAARAWEVFSSRSVKPNYATAPQWAIVPR